MKIKIGNIETDNLFLGPMAGVTDMPFRLICKEMGAGVVCTEMVSAKGILYHNRNTNELLTIEEIERPAAVQLFGSDPEIMGRAAGEIKDRNFDILDINMGCPVPKVVNNGEGSALLKNPELITEIVQAVKENVKKPVTVKIRKGFARTDDSCVEAALAAEKGGADLVAVHGRTREEFYSGHADWEAIKRVKQAVKIPVVGNGDVTSPEKAKEMLEQTGVDGIMIARGAQGNPWIFKQVKTYLDTGELLPGPGLSERVDMALRHARAEVAFKGEYTGIREMRSHLAWYMSGFKGASVLRGQVNYIESYEQMEKILKDYLEKTVHE